MTTKPAQQRTLKESYAEKMSINIAMKRRE
jgi:hypothetical protein